MFNAMKKATSWAVLSTMIFNYPMQTLGVVNELQGDLAQGKHVVADCDYIINRGQGLSPGRNQVVENPAINATDSNDTSYWVTDIYEQRLHDSHWIYVDFGTPTMFDTVKVIWDNEKYATDYSIQVSNTARDGDWQTVSEIKDNESGGSKEHKVGVHTTRYLRIKVNQCADLEKSEIKVSTISAYKVGADLSDSESVEKDKEWLTEDLIKTTSNLYPEIKNKDLQNVKATLNLVQTGNYGSQITWNVSPNDGNINLQTGEVIRSESDKNYTLTAEIKNGELTNYKEFEVVVKGNKVLGSQIVQLEDRSYMEVAGKPFLYSTVQTCGVQQTLGHTTPFEEPLPINWMENYFEKASKLGYKHIGIIVKWAEWEPEEPGIYDWTVVDKYIEWCDKYDMSWDIVYFGSNSCGGTRLTGVSGAEYWVRNVPKYLDKYEGYFNNGTHSGAFTVKSPVLKGENMEYIKAQELRAIQALMNHIAEKDVNKRTASFQVLNEPDWHSRYNTEDKRWIWDWISDIGVAIKASDYSLITRVNGGYAMGHQDFLPISQLPGIDAVGDDAYSANVDSIRKIITDDLKGTGFPHIAENDGSFANTSSLVLTTLLNGGGHHSWQFTEHWCDQGMHDYKSSKPYYKWELGDFEEIKWRESGRDMGRLNFSMNNIRTKIACAPLDQMVGFNVEVSTPAREYERVKLVDGIYAGYKANDSSVAMALKEDNKIYLVSDSETKVESDVAFFTYQKPLKATFGYLNDNEEWIIEKEATIINNNGKYEIPFEQKKCLRVEFSDEKFPVMENLKLSQGEITPTFNPDMHYYEATVGTAVERINITATLSDQNARYAVNGREILSGSTSQDIPLQFGENIIQISVKVGESNIQEEFNTYTISVTRTLHEIGGGTYENVAVRKSVTSPGYSGGWWHSIKNAVDGDETTFAQPQFPNPVWTLQVDLENTCMIDKVELITQPNVNYPKEFNVRTSIDGENWDIVATQKDFKGGKIKLSFNPVEARYVQLQGISANTGNDCGYAINEFKVFGVVEGEIIDKINAELVARSILKVPEIQMNQSKLVYPSVPNGFKIEICESDDINIIDLNGVITQGINDRVIKLKFKISNEAEVSDTATTGYINVIVPAKAETPNDINLALEKRVTVSGETSEVKEFAVDGNYSTRFVAPGGYPQWISVDLGSIVDFNQIKLYWDTAFPGKYTLSTSMDGVEWHELGEYANSDSTTKVHNFEIISARYVKLTGTGRGPNTNQMAVVEMEIYNANRLPEELTLTGLLPSKGQLSPTFDTNTKEYRVIVENSIDSITFTPTLLGQESAVKINDEIVVSGERSSDIPLKVGNNEVIIKIEDPVTGNIQIYTVIVERKSFNFGSGYDNKALNKAISTPGFTSGWWHPLQQINDGNMKSFGQPSTVGSYDIQIDLDGYYLVDTFKMYNGAANSPKAFEVKLSLDGIEWITVAEELSYNAIKGEYIFEPILTRYMLLDVKEATGCMAINEIELYGIEGDLTVQAIANRIQNVTVGMSEVTLKMPSIPEGYGIKIKETSDENVIDPQGNITRTDNQQEVEIIFEVYNLMDVNDKADTNAVQIIIPPSTLNVDNVLEGIVSTIEKMNIPKNATKIEFPTAPSGFNVTYKADQGTEYIHFNDNIATLSPVLVDVSPVIAVQVTNMITGEANNKWVFITIPARSATVQEVMATITELPELTKEDTRIKLPDAGEEFTINVVASSNKNVVRNDGSIIKPATDTQVDVYVRVVRIFDQTSTTKVFRIIVPGDVSKDLLRVKLKEAESYTNENNRYTASSWNIFIKAYDEALMVMQGTGASQTIIDEMASNLTAAIEQLELQPLTIVSIEDITVVVKQNEDYMLPEEITARMSDNSMENVPVVWDGIANTTTPGVYTFNGTVKDYEKKAKLTLNVTPEEPDEVTIIHIPDIYAKVKRNEHYELPNEVEAIKSDMTTSSVYVVWDEKIDTSASGIQEVYGKVDHYDKGVKATVEVLPLEYVLKIVVGENGIIVPEGMTAIRGEKELILPEEINLKLRILADEGYKLDTLLVDGELKDLQSEITITIDKEHVVEARFIVKDTTEVAVESISLNHTNVTLKKSEAVQLNATVLPSNATNKLVLWSSDNKKVAKVDSKGKVTAKGVGIATITATTVDGGKTATCTITVTAKDNGNNGGNSGNRPSNKPSKEKLIKE